MKRKPELLAPAGGMKQFVSAVENGADAIYVGGPRFNARMNAENFILDELEKAVEYGHLRGVKTYVTMNTLIKDEELCDALKYAKALYEIGVDALIIQDLGLGLLVHEKLPDFELHLSTQATVYNRDGVAAAKSLGYKRVVLARELAIDEIKLCCKESRKNSIGENGNSEKMDSPYDKGANSLSWPEIEVFVHGALCYSYSGQCQLSRYIGMYGASKDGKQKPARSGNCGSCAQPCRLPYQYVHEDGKTDTNPYPLSPRDLCMIDNLGELIEAGVTSLKIEGRMKSPEYVATVTRIYRKYIDRYLSKGNYKVSDEDRNALLQIFNRGEFTEGYCHNDPNENLMCGVSPKNQGMKVGKVSSYIKGKKSLLCEVELNGSLDMQDIVEIRDERGNSTSFKLTYLEKKGSHKAIIGDLKEQPGCGAAVYRVVNQKLNDEASVIGGRASASRMNINDFAQKILDNPAFSIAGSRKTGLTFTFSAFAGKEMKLSAELSDGRLGKLNVTKKLDDFVVQKAKSNPTEGHMVEEQLRKTGDTPFRVERIKLIMDDDIFLPLSKLNELRRTVIDELVKAIRDRSRRSIINSLDLMGDIICSEKSNKETFDSRKNDENLRLDENTENRLRRLTPAEYRDVCDDRSTVVLPQVSKGEFDKHMSDIVNKLYLKSENKKDRIQVVVNNIGELYMIGKKAGKEKSVLGVIGGYGLNILNRKCAEAYRKLGMSETFVFSSESFDHDEMSGVPLMITEHEMKSGKLIDRRGKEYAVEYNEMQHKTYIFALDDSKG